MMQASGMASPSPTYAEIGTAVSVLDGAAVRHVRELMNVTFEQAGPVPNAVDWSDPDRWIGERLSGELGALARRIWQESGKTLNPRYLYGHYVFVNRLKLLDQVSGIYRLGERGRRFLAGDDAILRELVALRSSKRRPSRPEPAN
jgi:restriction system protein